MVEIKEEVEEPTGTSMSYISSQVSISTNPSLSEAERSRTVDVLTIDLYNALNGETLSENKNIDLTEQLEKCHERIKELTLLEEGLKYKVMVNEIISIEHEQAIAALKAEKAIVEREQAITEIISAQIPAHDKTDLGYHHEKDEPSIDCSMLMFRMFVSSIPNTSSTQCSSSIPIPEDMSISSKLPDKGKSISHHPHKATKIAKLKVCSKPSVNQSSSSGTKITDISQRSTPKLKIDIKPKKSEELKVPPRSYAKGILGAGPSHLKFSNSTSHGLKTTFVYRKCYHYGLTDHIASKCPTATKANKIAKVKMNASKAEKVTKAGKSAKVKNDTKVKKLTKVKVTTNTESLDAVKIVEPSISTNPTGPIEKVTYVDGLKHNLLNISQLCVKDYEVHFCKKACSVVNKKGNLAFSGYRMENVYVIDMDYTTTENICFLFKASSDINWLWHKRLYHLNFKTLNSLSSKELVFSLPHHSYAKESLCPTCDKGKQTKASFKSKQISSVTSPLQLLHIDLFGPSDTPEELISFVRNMEVLNNLTVRSIRSDHGTEFKNSSLNNFFESKGISHNFSSVRTPQQNGVTERRNRTIVEVARSMLSDSHLSAQFWAEAVNTACFTQNRSLIVKRFSKTAYELFHGRKPSISFLHIFGCQCFILNNKDALGMFDPKVDDGICLGYSPISKAYRAFNKRRQTIEETIHVTFDESRSANSKPIADNDELNAWMFSHYRET
ncbi:hypothetical protein L6452_06625 [Arctium lappa]|uniref:Uncharacterized protein n=1 Tax=Arctium lappa TaxID=4217 RepID=A0ACB9EJN7_ARCLA|nr:hypothetical protein L6452_06625 [Arctium lappa]